MVGAEVMDWQLLTYVLGAVTAALLGILWTRVSGDLARVSDRLAEVATMVHGHAIRLEMIEGGTMAGNDHMQPEDAGEIAEMDARSRSWLDEFWSFVIAAPMIAAFVPGAQDFVSRGSRSFRPTRPAGISVSWAWLPQLPSESGLFSACSPLCRVARADQPQGETAA
ncbi:MAG: hypothetical protein HZT43_10825 [Exiguobacterium profundum]|nr:MAG: hypothetical protein HZT43_10825 [Exiguobacterium profundum]